MGIKIDSDVLLCRMNFFCERCYRETNGYNYDPPGEGCKNDLCPMKFVVNEVTKMQAQARLVETINNTVYSQVSINKQSGAVSTNNSEHRASSKRRCPNCGSYWMSAEYCCNCGARTVEDDI